MSWFFLKACWFPPIFLKMLLILPYFNNPSQYTEKWCECLITIIAPLFKLILEILIVFFVHCFKSNLRIWYLIIYVCTKLGLDTNRKKQYKSMLTSINIIRSILQQRSKSCHSLHIYICSWLLFNNNNHVLGIYWIITCLTSLSVRVSWDIV